MRPHSAAALALAAGLAGPACAGQAQPVIRESDSALTCIQMADEAAELSQSMGGGRENLLGRMGGAARAGASWLIPGAGLVIAGADALTADQRREREAAALAVQNRWFYLNGLYSGRGCDQPAVPAPASTAVAPPAARIVVPTATLPSTPAGG